MTKTERVNDMLRFLNDKDRFNLRDIMNRYNISRSTALRDIRSLEELGMPIYSESGRNGAYGVLPNKLLSPIIFTTDEIMALYFALITLKDYQSTPFHIYAERLKDKVKSCLSSKNKEFLLRTEQVLSMGSIPHTHQSPFLKDILYHTVNEHICRITYIKNGIKVPYSVQFYDISSHFGQWYATGLDCETGFPRVFRCDKILSITHSHDNPHSPANLIDLRGKGTDVFRNKGAVDYRISITPHGADIFAKENYPTMSLHQENDGLSISGFYNKGEETFIADYFLRFGTHITAVSPVELKTLLLDRLQALQKHISTV